MKDASFRSNVSLEDASKLLRISRNNELRTSSRSSNHSLETVTYFNSNSSEIASRMSPVGCSADVPGRESDNLVEEVYISRHSIPKGRNLQTKEESIAKGLSQYDGVVSIDLGTTFSGYTFAYTHNSPSKHCQKVAHLESGDAVERTKKPTVLLLTPEEKFHSFGFAAQDFYQDLDPQEAKDWLYFDNVTLKLETQNLKEMTEDARIIARNGVTISAQQLYGHLLHYFKDLIEKEVLAVENGLKLRWVVAVPTHWTEEGKRIIRRAACMVGICSSDDTENLLVPLKSETASIYCHHVLTDQIIASENTSIDIGKFMIVNCGGRSANITVHCASRTSGTLHEVYKTTKDCASFAVDREFVKLMGSVFGSGFLKRFEEERPAAYYEFLSAFETRKRSATPFQTTFMKIFPPFAFVDFYHHIFNSETATAVKKFGCPELTWSNEGILKLHPNLMNQLFQPAIDSIIEIMDSVLANDKFDNTISHIFLLGGFCESPIVQKSIKDHFSDRHHIIIPQAMNCGSLRGGILYGINPTLLRQRRVTHAYGVGIVKPFLNGIHPIEKLVIRGGHRWCVDLLERLIESGEPVSLGQIVSKKYVPASKVQTEIILQVYATVSNTAQFITDPNVFKCGQLKLNLQKIATSKPREITISLIFGGEEVTASAADSISGETVTTKLDIHV